VFPIYILEEGVELPSEGTYYVVAQDGIYLRKETGLIQATVRVNGISSLEEIVPTANLRLPKLPPEVVVRALLFFRSIYRQLDSEAVVLLHYSQENRSYRLYCPEQTVSGMSVSHYDADGRLEGYQLVGSIHSHCDFGAFHSGIDRRDEHDFDGLHITIGRVDQPYFTVSCSVVVNDNRFPTQPEDVLTGVREVSWKPRPGFTYRREMVPEEEQNPTDPGWIGTVKFLFGFSPLIWNPEGYVWAQDPSQFYDMVLPDGQDYRHVGFPRTWMERVTKVRPVLAKKLGPPGDIYARPPTRRKSVVPTRIQPKAREGG